MKEIYTKSKKVSGKYHLQIDSNYEENNGKNERKRQLKSGQFSNSITTPFQQALFRGCIECIRLLVESPPYYSVDGECGGEGLRPVHIAAREGHLHLLRYLLASGANLNKTDSLHQSPLHHAVLGRELRAVRWLLRHGATCNSADKLGRTPLQIAVQNQYMEIATLLTKSLSDSSPSSAPTISAHSRLYAPPYSSKHPSPHHPPTHLVNSVDSSSGNSSLVTSGSNSPSLTTCSCSSAEEDYGGGGTGSEEEDTIPYSSQSSHSSKEKSSSGKIGSSFSRSSSSTSSSFFLHPQTPSSSLNNNSTDTEPFYLHPPESPPEMGPVTPMSSDFISPPKHKNEPISSDNTQDSSPPKSDKNEKNEKLYGDYSRVNCDKNLDKNSPPPPPPPKNPSNNKSFKGPPPPPPMPNFSPHPVKLSSKSQVPNFESALRSKLGEKMRQNSALFSDDSEENDYEDIEEFSLVTNSKNNETSPSNNNISTNIMTNKLKKVINSGSNKALPFIPPNFPHPPCDALIKPSEYLKSIQQTKTKFGKTLSLNHSSSSSSSLISNSNGFSKIEEEKLRKLNSCVEEGEEVEFQEFNPEKSKCSESSSSQSSGICPEELKRVNLRKTPMCRTVSAPVLGRVLPDPPHSKSNEQSPPPPQIPERNAERGRDALSPSAHFSQIPERNAERGRDVYGSSGVTRSAIIAELAESSQVGGVREWKEELRRREAEEEKAAAQQIASIYSPLKFVTEVPDTDGSGVRIPEWKRQMLAKKAAERARREAEEMRKIELEAKKASSIPPWKRQLLQRRDSVSEPKNAQ